MLPGQQFRRMLGQSRGVQMCRAKQDFSVSPVSQQVDGRNISNLLQLVRDLTEPVRIRIQPQQPNISAISQQAFQKRIRILNAVVNHNQFGASGLVGVEIPGFRIRIEQIHCVRWNHAVSLFIDALGRNIFVNNRIKDNVGSSRGINSCFHHSNTGFNRLNRAFCHEGHRRRTH